MTFKSIINFLIIKFKDFIRHILFNFRNFIFNFIFNYKVYSSKNINHDGRKFEIKGLGFFFSIKYKKLKGDIVSATLISSDKKYFLKIEFVKNKSAKNSLEEETQILKMLNFKNCQSAPKIINSGKLNINQLNFLDESILKLLKNKNLHEVPYILLEYIPNIDRKINFVDVLFSILEQKGLGVFHGNIKPGNLKFDKEKNLCILTNYSHATTLDRDVSLMSPKNFIKWCDNFDQTQNKTKDRNFLRNLNFFFRSLNLSSLLYGEAFKLLNTTLYRKQVTTHTKDGIYHSIDNNIFYISGIRGLEKRNQLLDKIKFMPKEKVLDVGCNAGLLCHYLYKRGCDVTGAEMDKPIVHAATMIANGLSMPIKFIHMDLDEQKRLPEYDTICLFSVIHHTKDLKENGKKVANSCKRIIIECKEIEKGSKPVQNGQKEKNSSWIKNSYWMKTSSWSYKNEKELLNGLQSLFPGFNNIQKIGAADRSRSMYELRK